MSFHNPFTLRTTSPTTPSSVHPFRLFIQNTKMTVSIYNVYLFHSFLFLFCIFVHRVPSRLPSLFFFCCFYLYSAPFCLLRYTKRIPLPALTAPDIAVHISHAYGFRGPSV